MSHPLLFVSQSDSLIQIVDINSHTEWQTVQIQIRSQLIWIYTVCKGRVYLGSAGPGFTPYHTYCKLFQVSLTTWRLVKTVVIKGQNNEDHDQTAPYSALFTETWLFKCLG